MHNVNLSQKLAVVAQIPASSAPYAAGSYVSPAFDATRVERALALCLINNQGAGTVNFRFQHCSGSASSLAAWADINATSCITSTYGSTRNGSLALLELRLDQNPATSQFVRVLASAATSTWAGNVVVLGNPATYEPASQFNSPVVDAITVF